MSEHSSRQNTFTADGGPHKATRIRDVADGLRRIGEFESAEMLTAYADLREQIERARADEVTGDAVKRALSTFNTARNYDGDAAGVAMRKVLTEFAAIEAALSAQPAQAAKVDMDGKAQWDELAAILGCDGDNVDLVFRTAKRIMSERLPTAEPVAQGEAVPSWADALAEKWACCIAAEHFAGPTLRQCASELLDAAYGRKGPPYSFVYGLGRAQPASPEQPAGRQGDDRGALLYLMQQFDSESWYCPRCGHAEDTATMDSADYLRQYLKEHPAAPVGVPDGFVLVPIYPTEAMQKAGGHVNSEWLNDSEPIGESRYTRPMIGVWDAMLAAAPPSTPPTTGAIGENGK